MLQPLDYASKNSFVTRTGSPRTSLINQHLFIYKQLSIYKQQSNVDGLHLKA
jgi:hypothetical protein